MLTLLLILVPFFGYSQIGYKYKKWIKKHEYLSKVTESGTIAPYRLFYKHDAAEQSFRSLMYVVSSTSGKIIEVFYVFPNSYSKAVEQYCRKSHFEQWDDNLGIVFYNVDQTLRFSYSKDESPPYGVLLRISAMTPFVKYILGWEKK